MSRDYNQGIQFERPIGAPADVRELEYVSALHQTNEEEIRMDGTIRGTYKMLVCVCLYYDCKVEAVIVSNLLTCPADVNNNNQQPKTFEIT